MIRVLVFILLLGVTVMGLGWLSDQPGDIAVTFRDRRYETSPVIAAIGVLAIAFIFTAVLGALGFLLRLPKKMRLSSRRRKQNKGLAALSRGMIAASAGDIRRAQRASADAARLLGAQPMTLLLEAQTALLAGDRKAAEQTFARMAENPETRVLGLRGLHGEARRRGDAEAAHSYAEAAHRIGPLPWAGNAVLEHHASRRDWIRALEAIDANLSQKIIDKPTYKRQRAVLQTAIAQELRDSDPAEALKLASGAIVLAPNLVPAAALVARLLARRGDIRKSSRLLESAWKLAPHPDLANIYLDMRPGDSSADRLKRAQSLARLTPNDLEGRIAVARTAISAREFTLAREAMAPLMAAPAGERPTTRMCMIMADLEEAENGPSGVMREWLARAARAARDKAWVADGIVSDLWAPFSPVSGKLDAWTWQTPPEQLSNVWDPRIDPVLETQAPAASVAAEPLQSSPAQLIKPGEAIRLKTIGKDPFPLVTAPDDPGPARA